MVISFGYTITHALMRYKLPVFVGLIYENDELVVCIL